MRRCGRPCDPPPLNLHVLILAPEVVESRLLASVLAGMAVGRCGQPTSKPWDEQPSLGDAQDALGMTIVAVKCGCIDPSASNLSLLIQPT
jgi:hypothetical protein